MSRGQKVDPRDIPAADDGPILINLGDVTPARVAWLWERRIARGKLALIAGEVATGKTTVTLDITARVTKGLAWPDGGKATAGNVLLLTSEDALDDTLRPVVERQGGESKRVTVLQAVRIGGRECAFNLDRDLPALETALEQTGASFVVISPLSAYLGDRDSYRDADVRAILTPLATLAEKTHAAVLGILHLTKAAQRALLLRAMGSVAFVAQARTVLVAGKDPNGPRFLLTSVKSNLTALAPTLAYTISDRGLAWDTTPVDGTPEQLLAAEEVPTRAEARALLTAQQFLRDLLRNGPVASKQVEADARANGISQRTLWRAKTDLGILAERGKTQEGSKASPWYWMLPVPEPPR
jgi:putative DNA primase/helicase